jgi:hypothetical protein
MNLKSILNKTSPQVHTVSEFEVFDIPRKLVKYLVHLSNRKNIKINIFLHPNCKLISFWSQGILGVNPTLLTPKGRNQFLRHFLNLGQVS